MGYLPRRGTIVLFLDLCTQHHQIDRQTRQIKGCLVARWRRGKISREEKKEDGEHHAACVLVKHPPMVVTMWLGRCGWNSIGRCGGAYGVVADRPDRLGFLVSWR
jgi:hypothetical protein